MDREGWTALHYIWSFARDGKSTELLKILISSSQGILPNSRDLRGWTALHKAAVCGSAEEIALLVRQGAHTKALLNNRSVLHLAAAYHNDLALEELAQPGYELDVNASDAVGWSPLHLAAYNAFSNGSTVATLLRSRADPRKLSIPTANDWLPENLREKSLTPSDIAKLRSTEAWQNYRSALGESVWSCDHDDVEPAGRLAREEVFWDAPESL